jgi:spore maturation protein CgeB
LENRPLFGDDFASACCAFKINLGFLRKINRDQQTTRSVEIPACGAFMLAERTPEHLELFAEGVEAEFFGSPGELLDKTLYYLANDEHRRAIAHAGLQRCRRSRYSNEERMHEVLTNALDLSRSALR